MSIVQTFYDKLANDYDKLFLDWDATTTEQALILEKIFIDNGYSKNVQLLDCACGIGTQSIGLASIGYNVNASDISKEEIKEAKKRAKIKNVNINFKYADFRNLSDSFKEKFDIIIAMDNALPHMLTENDLSYAINSIINQISSGGMFVASIRDYDEIMNIKPLYSPPYIHKTVDGQRVSFQTWEWKGNNYRLIQYIIDDENSLNIKKFECEYRAIEREKITYLLYKYGCSSVEWKFPEETGFYQPIVIAKK